MEVPEKVNIGDKISWRTGTVETIIRIRNGGHEWQSTYSDPTLADDDPEDKDEWWKVQSYSGDGFKYYPNETEVVKKILEKYGEAE
jgi:hypothetical protein